MKRDTALELLSVIVQPFTLEFVYTGFQVLDEASFPNEIRTTSGFHASFDVGGCHVVIMVMFVVR